MFFVHRCPLSLQVFEKRHLLILSWCSSRRDLEVVQRILTELCLAYRREGGVVVVVLCSREKVWMESWSKEVVPYAQRHGSTIVFREGNPLVPASLQMVAAERAAATIILSDNSR